MPCAVCCVLCCECCMDTYRALLRQYIIISYLHSSYSSAAGDATKTTVVGGIYTAPLAGWILTGCAAHKAPTTTNFVGNRHLHRGLQRCLCLVRSRRWAFDIGVNNVSRMPGLGPSQFGIARKLLLCKNPHRLNGPLASLVNLKTYLGLPCSTGEGIR